MIFNTNLYIYIKKRKVSQIFMAVNSVKFLKTKKEIELLDFIIIFFFFTLVTFNSLFFIWLAAYTHNHKIFVSFPVFTFVITGIVNGGG